MGAGKMGGALMTGLVQAKYIKAAQLIVKDNSSAESLKKLGYTVVSQASDLAGCDFIVVAVPPQAVTPVLTELKAEFQDKNIPILSVAGGFPLEKMQDIMGQNYPLARCIPNTAVEVCQGTMPMTFSKAISDSDQEMLEEAMASVGKVFVMNEKSLEIASSVGGCAPAFTDLYLEALSDAGVMYGLNRAQSYEIAAQMLRGASELALQTGEHPGVLKDQVTTPGGSTIKGVVALEQGGFRAAVINAVSATME
ncbi:MAG: pyrroline-5-carboxylate reductase [Micrococcaceae bacterium]